METSEMAAAECQKCVDSIESSSKATSRADEILKLVVETVKVANSLPKVGENYELYSSYPEFSGFMNLMEKRALDLISKVYRRSDIKLNLLSVSDGEERIDRLIDANDTLLERANTFIDQASGIRKQQDNVVMVATERKNPVIMTSWNRNKQGMITNTPKSSTQSPQDEKIRSATIRLLAARNVARPQLRFVEHIDNTNIRFVSKLKYKHNASKPWKGNIVMFDDGNEVEQQFDDQLRVQHPYQYELEHLQLPKRWSLVADAEEPRRLEDTPLKFIETSEELRKLRDLLMQQDVFAVDIEHHSYRSFQGITCLLQFSTRTDDFIVDPFGLWGEMHILNEPFTKPSIIKVFHGADFDIQWLQRDFGIYVVNMFDTSQAMRALHYARFGLNYLLKYLLNKDVDKQFQLADWRMRPLPDELVNYAREDTHYLLYCFDRLRNQLIDTGNEQLNLVNAVFSKCRSICLKHYEKPMFGNKDYLVLAQKKSFTNRQLFALEHLFAWRDKIARLEDESIGYVLPNHMLLQIAEVLPREMQGILACCNPVPLLVKRDLHELHRIIIQARNMPLKEKEFDSKPIEFPKRQLNPLIHSPHDISHTRLDEELSFVTAAKRPRLELCERNQISVSLKEKPSLALFTTKEDRDAFVLNSWTKPYYLYLLSIEQEKAAMLSQATTEQTKVCDAAVDVEQSSSGVGSEQPTTSASKVEDSCNQDGIEESSPLVTVSKSKRRKRKRPIDADSASTNDKTPGSFTKPSTVQPFDYEAAKQKLFPKDRPAAPKSDHFNPQHRTLGGKGKLKKKSKLPKAAQKSVTYASKEKRQRR